MYEIIISVVPTVLCKFVFHYIISLLLPAQQQHSIPGASEPRPTSTPWTKHVSWLYSQAESNSNCLQCGRITECGLWVWMMCCWYKQIPKSIHCSLWYPCIQRTELGIVVYMRNTVCRMCSCELSLVLWILMQMCISVCINFILLFVFTQFIFYVFFLLFVKIIKISSS